MNTLSEIKNSIRSIASGVPVTTSLFTAKVKRVSGETCTVEVEGVELSDVRLRAVINGNDSKLLITPKVGSYVLLADMSGNMSRLVVLNYSEIEKIEINSDGNIVLNGGENMGIVKIEKLVQRLNKIENKIGELMDVLNNWTPIAQDGGLALKTAASLWYSGQMELSQREELEDKKIQH